MIELLQQFDNDDIHFAATFKNNAIKAFLNVVKAINATDDLICQMSSQGVKFIVEESKCFQTIAYIQSGCFYHHKIKDKEECYSFGVSLSSFTEYLNSFTDNDSSSLKLIYFGPNSLLALNFVQTEDDSDDEGDSQIITEYLLRIKHCSETIDFEEPDESLANTTILNGPDFFEILNDINKSNDELEIEFDSNHNIKLRSCGLLRYETNVEIPRTCDTIISGTLKQATKFRYKFTYIKLILKTMVMSQRISLRTYVDGLLKVQLVISTGDEDNPIFVEYFVVPSIDED